MSFSLSTFTVEINSTPTVTFQAKWHAEADEVCRTWADMHRYEMPEEHSGRFALPPVIKVRLASTSEKALFEAAGYEAEFCGDVKIVRLIETVGYGAESSDSLLTEDRVAEAEPSEAHRE